MVYKYEGDSLNITAKLSRALYTGVHISLSIWFSREHIEIRFNAHIALSVTNYIYQLIIQVKK